MLYIGQEVPGSIDEITIGYKGSYAGTLKQYNPKKPTKWGFKFFGLASSSGQVYDFLPYCGSTTFLNCGLSEEELKMGVGAQSVISLCKSIKDPDNTIVFFDNWFNGLNLLAYLREKYNLLALGTIRKDRIQKCPLTAEAAFKKLPPGSVESHVSAQATVVVRWLDTKPVLLASSAAGVEPMSSAKGQFVKSSGCRQDIACPRIIELYNQYIGGVDLSDQYVAENSVPTRSKRWYFPIFGYKIDLALANSYIQYVKDDELLGLVPELKTSKDFRLEVSKSLRTVESHRGRPTTAKAAKKNLIQSPSYRPSEETRLDGLNHWPTSERTRRKKIC
ncbi:PiggyBac transposable element-derived protein 3 [Frankliniella fusca]|uniref:PiggyBac transposable element-derived protein 3 n=1 Tax=Frankliniella fusca TaxID=407009 RepID=A0AAE1HRE1_9NEOP|nr:PiggyBac transposable element-derived protein 3 [Frankliniella fusca]